MRYTFADYRKAADVVADRLGGFQPEIAMILGSGLGDMADLAENPIVIPYKEIPGFSVSTAPGHKGQLVFGTLAGKRVAVMQGRLHAYEGYTFEEVCSMSILPCWSRGSPLTFLFTGSQPIPG